MIKTPSTAISTFIKSAILLLFILGADLAKAQETKSTLVPVLDNKDIFYEASKQKILGNYSAALNLFNEYLAKHPNDAATLYEIADIYSQQKELEKALPLAEKAVELDGTNKWYKILLYQLYQSQSQYDEAGEVIASLLAAEPDNLEYMQELALNYIYAGDMKNAIKIYDSIDELIGVTEEVATQKERIYLMTGKTDKAIEEIERLSATYPDETRFMEMLAELYMTANMDEKALATYTRILEAEPDNPYINISLSDYYRQKGDKEKSYGYLQAGFGNPNLDIDTKVQILLAYYTVNELYGDRKDEAFTLAKLMLNAHPEDPKAWSIYADLLYQDKQLEAARDAFHQVIAIDSGKYLVWEQLLFVESELNDFNAMAAEGERAVTLFPQQPIPYLLAGAGRFQQKNYGRAAELFKTGASFVVSNNILLEQFYAYMGDTYFQLKDHAASDAAYDKALALNPANTIVLNNYAYYLSLRNERLNKAEEMAKKAVELDPGNSSNEDTYGWVLFQLGKYEEAKEWIAKAIGNDKESAVVIEHYGDVLWKLGEEKEAVKYWEKAQKMGEGSEYLEKKVTGKKYVD
jgi:tetratricopeptide (TPR) repeat protein